MECTPTVVRIVFLADHLLILLIDCNRYLFHDDSIIENVLGGVNGFMDSILLSVLPLTY